MIKQLLSLSLFGLLCLFLFSQNEALLRANAIPSEMRENANAVVRLEEVNIDIKSSSQMIVKNKRIITVFNKKGNATIDAYVHYDDGIKINDIQVLVYDTFGNEIKKIKRKDFKDVSAVPGGTLYSDSRVLYMDYTPIAYPYTVVFNSETEYKNTSYIRPFRPITDYLVSVEQSVYFLKYSNEIKLNTKQKNFKDFNIKKLEQLGLLHYQVENLKAVRLEDHSPGLLEMYPNAMVAVVNFTYEGRNGNGEDWKSLGKWMFDELLEGRNTVSPETKNTILALVENVDDPVEKIKTVYQFVQDNTRYISVQEGIGGNQPIAAIDVDRVKYGDCKGLSNYTRALLEVVGIEAYYTRVHASNEKIDVDEDFVSFQGQTNHIILNVPIANEASIWLECTSQKIPFGFLGDFTDDRNVLLITPEGGKIAHTPKYGTSENSLRNYGRYNILENGTIVTEVKMLSKGIKYDERFLLETLSQSDLDSHYKTYWKYINNLSFNAIKNVNDKESIVYAENIRFTAQNYGNLVGDRMLVCLNAFNKNTYVPDRYRNRTMPLKIERGFVEIDSVQIVLPSGFKVEVLPPPVELTTKFGVYKMNVVTPDGQSLIYNRKFLVNDGDYPKEDYDDFREFYREVARHDNSKVSLIKS